ncbi:MAG: ribonuclease R [Alphaproteobacteria bacterium]|nr:ribonuclease R [Alphaproteobacteria bacterium]
MKHYHSRKPTKKFEGGSPKRGFRNRIKHQPETKEPASKPSRVAAVNVVGIVRKAAFGWTLQPSDRREKNEYLVRPSSKAEQYAGELVVAEILQSSKNGRREVSIKDCIGSPDDPKNISLIAINAHNIPYRFSDEALEEASAAKPVTQKDRTDLRSIPLVTIDGEDARDFDDAVFAEPDVNGWHLIVAIADVSHYVKARSPLDNEAYERGNSVYFPDRVVPMLPEALSNGLCSLNPNVDRACMAVHMWISKSGELTRWQFVRGIMKSCARLTYEQVQAAMDGKADNYTKPLLDKIIKPLYGAYSCLAAARVKRGTLELDLPERKVILNKDGSVKAIKQRERFDSHKLIEEFMIAANVSAAVQLGEKGNFCLYRVHDKPNEIKLTALREFLEEIGFGLPPGKQLHPRMLTQILEKAANTPHAQVVNEFMLRSQAQAIYSPDNIGHFGLALGKYAHFTSPIRRYSDLIVHRGLINVCKLGNDGLMDDDVSRLSDIGEHLSNTERRAATAEREVVDRFTTLFLAEKIGEVFSARISGVASFGLFARLDENGADGIIPFNSLPRDFYNYDEKHQSLVGQREGRTYQLAMPVKVRLEKADKLTGSISFAIVEDEEENKSVKKTFHKRRPVKTPSKNKNRKWR